MKVQEYIGEDGSNPFKAWFDGLNAQAAARVFVEEKEVTMALTRDYKQTIRERAARDPDFAASLMNEAVTSILNGEPETARLILRELVNSTIGFEHLAEELNKPSKSVHRMLSPKGNPTMDNLTNIFSVLQRRLHFDIEVKLTTHNKRRLQYS